MAEQTKTMLRYLPAGLLLLAIAALCAQAQSSPGAVSAQEPAPSPSPSPTGRPSRTNLGSPEAELLERARIKHEEESHKELRERADEAAQLGAALRQSFESGRGLGRDDLKKLERVEKLARKIRSGVGGSGDEASSEELPEGLGAAVEHLAALTEELNKEVKKTSRLVVSVTVIERSNRLIGLVRHLRSIIPR